MPMRRMPYRDLTFTARALLAFLATRFMAGAFFLKGAQMPSIAEEVATDLRTLRWR